MASVEGTQRFLQRLVGRQASQSVRRVFKHDGLVWGKFACFWFLVCLRCVLAGSGSGIALIYGVQEPEVGIAESLLLSLSLSLGLSPSPLFPLHK